MRERRLERDSELRKVLEDVFDYRTVMAVYRLMNRGILAKLYGTVSTGKEARVYWGKTPKGEDVAVKIYLVWTSEFRKSRLKYILGDPRFENAPRDPIGFVNTWCRKEFRNLKRAYSVGLPVPRPIAFEENILVMEFVGGNGSPYPLLKDSPPSNPEKVLDVLRSFIRRLYQEAGLVHADLSEYNVMIKEGDEVIVIDFGSAVLKSHPNALEFLRNDIRNVYRYFREIGLDPGDPEEFFEEVTGSSA
ncbi:serine protein kinase RIO [Infirmifilum lucidum]|uniref:non-specific serine/threonine protein kinase n=1 Tax=Infirmifilum lucidum TaxID=2776706 RepID=A0A7L9FER3_9CREN|nr:serine protein kinase RIO [Infirmifilum lucidum]QOJ78177.1 serine protein kinase RIO [Infirmifilum lucidum]